MTKETITDITVVLDRSGSMSSMVEDVQGGMKKFLEEQKAVDGRARFTLIEFDNEYNIVCEGVDIEKVRDVVLSPRGSTALIDAVGKAINTAEERIKGLSPEDKPDQTVFVIITDGHENASTEYSLKQVKDLIEKHKDNWQFVFMGADINAFAEAGNLGMAMGSTLNYNSNIQGSTLSNYGKLSRSMTNFRDKGEVLTSSANFFDANDVAVGEMDENGDIKTTTETGDVTESKTNESSAE